MSDSSQRLIVWNHFWECRRRRRRRRRRRCCCCCRRRRCYIRPIASTSFLDYYITAATEDTVECVMEQSSRYV